MPRAEPLASDVIGRRYEKFAAALIAIARTLERERPLAGGEDEFLALYARLRGADAEVFTRLWTEPGAGSWSQSVYQLLGAELHDGVYRHAPAEPAARRATLQDWLDRFKAFVAGLGRLTGESVRFTRPLPVTLPFAVPGTDELWLGEGAAGEGEALLAGVQAGELAWSGPSGGAAPRRRRVARVRYAGCDVRLGPWAMHSPGRRYEGLDDIAADGVDSQDRWVDTVRGTLELIERYEPDTWAEFRDVVRWIALKPGADDGTYSSSSFSELPGSFAASIVDNPWELGETFIHEFHHNRLFCVEEDTPLLEFSRDPGAYYSPWRPDPRPARGVLHAISVFVPVCRYWRGVLGGGEAKGDLAAYAGDVFVRSTLRIRCALESVAGHPGFTPAGRAWLERAGEESRALEAEARALGLGEDTPAWRCMADGRFDREWNLGHTRRLSVGESLREHRRAYDARHGAADPGSRG